MTQKAVPEQHNRHADYVETKDDEIVDAIGCGVDIEAMARNGTPHSRRTSPR
jgi:hypothetical protein